MNTLVAQIIVDIINKEMDMPKNAVWVRNQDMVIPNDNGLYIIVGMVNTPHIICNETYMKEIGGNQHQINEVQTSEVIQIDILSRSNAALTRNIEVVMAMQSFYSQQQQELNNFRIYRCPRSFIDASEAEGGSQLNRYSITIAAMVWYRKDTILGDYYDDFTTRVDDEKTIGTETPLIEFEINSGGIVP